MCIISVHFDFAYNAGKYSLYDCNPISLIEGKLRGISKKTNGVVSKFAGGRFSRS